MAAENQKEAQKEVKNDSIKEDEKASEELNNNIQDINAGLNKVINYKLFIFYIQLYFLKINLMKIIFLNYLVHKFYIQCEEIFHLIKWWA